MELRRVARRAIVAGVVALQLTTVVRGYDDPHRVFAFQMFPESSRWQADIWRVDGSGARTPINQDWEYRWSDLVRGRGLTNPFVEHHADAGLDGQLAFFQAALDWVADNTPEDRDTVYLEAEVIVRHNGREPQTLRFRSADRTGVEVGGG